MPYDRNEMCVIFDIIADYANYTRTLQVFCKQTLA